MTIWILPFQVTGQPQATIDKIAWDWWPVRFLYALLVLSTVVCSWHRVARDVRRLGRALNRPAIPPPDSLYLEDFSTAELAARLRAHGYTLTERESGFDAVRNRWSPLGGTVFHVALLVFMFAIVVQHSFGSTAELRVTEGQSFADASAAVPEWAKAAVAGLTLKRIEPGYYRDVLLFTKLDATLGEADGGETKMSLSSPHWMDPFTHLSIQDYGLAPHIRTTNATGTVLDEAVVAMNIFPPGAEDSVFLPSSGLDLSVVAYPDHGTVDGRDVSLSYNILKSAFRVVAQLRANGSIVGRGVVALDEPMAAGNTAVTFTGLSRYGTFRVFRSYAPPLALIAGVLGLAGLLARFASPRHDVVAWDAGGGVSVDSWLDAFGRQEGRNRVARILGEERAG